MAWADVGHGLRGAVDTFTDLYKFGKDQEMQGRQIDQRAALADQKNQVALFLQELKNLGLLKVQDAKNEGGENIATINQTGAMNRAQLTEDGRNTRFAQGDATTRLLGGMRDRTTQRGQDLGFEAAGRRDRTTRRGQDVGFSIAGMRDETARRGQDVGRATATDRLLSGQWQFEADQDRRVWDRQTQEAGDLVNPWVEQPATPSTLPVPLRRAAPVPVPLANGAPSRPSGSAAPSPAAAPATAQPTRGTVTLADLQKIAAAKGTTVEEQQRRAEAKGYTITR